VEHTVEDSLTGRDKESKRGTFAYFGSNPADAERSCRLLYLGKMGARIKSVSYAKVKRLVQGMSLINGPVERGH